DDRLDVLRLAPGEKDDRQSNLFDRRDRRLVHRERDVRFGLEQFLRVRRVVRRLHDGFIGDVWGKDGLVLPARIGGEGWQAIDDRAAFAERKYETVDDGH